MLGDGVKLGDKILYVDTFVDTLRKFSRTIQVNVISNGGYSGIFAEKYRIDNQKLQLHPQLPCAWDEAMYIFQDPRITHSTGLISHPSSTGLLERSLQEMVAYVAEKYMAYVRSYDLRRWRLQVSRNRHMKSPMPRMRFSSLPLLSTRS